MRIEIINTGSELMLGRVLNTHQQWLCRELADRGYIVSRQVSVPDAGPDIQQAVKEALSRADLILVTGGLGPTSDDITRDLMAALIGKPLKEDPAVVRHIEARFAARKWRMPESTRVQAMVPEGALVLLNAHGTAPGLAMEVAPNPFRAGSTALLVMLPGPPRELRPMFTDQVVPLLARVAPLPRRFVCRTLRSIGIGESSVEERIAGVLEPLVQKGLEIGYCARPGRVDVRLVGACPEAEELVKQGEAIVRAELGDSIYGIDDCEQEKTIVDFLSAAHRTLAIAESCTGGHIANLITNVPGASAVLLAGLVTYSNEAKRKFLGVREETLRAHGAVSGEVAREMAVGAKLATGADYAISVTGIAGPGGGSETKPVGTVFIGLATDDGCEVRQNSNPWDRETFKQVTTQQALDMLRRAVLAKA